MARKTGCPLSASVRLCSSGSSPAHQTGFRRAPRGEHLSTRSRLSSVESHFLRAIRFPQHLFSVHDHGRQRSGRGPQHTFLPLRWPDCTLSRLRAEEYDRPATQSIATPEPSSRTIPTLDRTLVACWSLECVTTLGRRRSCPSHLTIDRFHQPCLLPWRAPHCHRNTAGVGRER